MRTVGLLHALSMVACADGDALPAELGDCADGEGPTWAEVAPLFEAACTSCHSSALSPVDRSGAPVGTDFDTPEAAGRLSFVTWSTLVTGSMPKGGPALPRDDALRIWGWLSCEGT